MQSSRTNSPQNMRLRYAAPTLTIFGSVRDLTGAKSPGNTDSATQRSVPSDRSYKENIVEVGRHPAGFGLYLFDYKSELCERLGHGRKFGVMADEVEKVVPEAVFIDADGFRRINYDLLGIKLN